MGRQVNEERQEKDRHIRERQVTRYLLVEEEAHACCQKSGQEAVNSPLKKTQSFLVG